VPQKLCAGRKNRRLRRTGKQTDQCARQGRRRLIMKKKNQKIVAAVIAGILVLSMLLTAIPSFLR
jgi:hypothetical protein